MINVELRIGIRTSREASNTTSTIGFRCPGGNSRFSRRCLYTFSTSTMASSTKDPMAMAIPTEAHRIDGQPHKMERQYREQ